MKSDALRGEQNIWAETIAGQSIKIERMLHPVTGWVYYAKPAFLTHEPWYECHANLDRLRDAVKARLG